MTSVRDDATVSTPSLRAVELEAPAKINLYLRILGRRPDGFHDLETLFQAIHLEDRVRVTIDGDAGESVALRVTAPGSSEAPDLGPIEENLAYRAARAFADAVGSPGAITIELEKRIPAGAGLGGGSSDAAAVLRALAALSGFSDLPRLRRLASALGSDVPFFLCETPLAIGRGRGERLTELTPLPEATLVLGLPGVEVSTAEAYGALAASRADTGAPTPAAPDSLDPSSLGGWPDVLSVAMNDFESVVPGGHAAIRASLEGLRAEGARLALLSGSGAASFGIFDRPETARRAADRLGRDSETRYVVTRTRSSMPVARTIDVDPGRGG